MNAEQPKQAYRFRFSSRLAGLAAAVALLLAPAAGAAEAIRIGEINSHNSLSPVGQAYRNGLALALEEINAGGGVLGRPLELVARDDDGDADQAARNARELARDQHVAVLTGTMLSNVALAVAREAARSKTVLVVGDALSDAITLDKGNRYTFRVRPSTYMQAAMLAEQAARLPGRRWAVVAPNYEYGQSAVASFKLLLKQARPDVEFVNDQWPALGKIKADDVVRAIRQARPDAIFNATFGDDLQKFVQAGNRQQLFAGTRVVSMMSAGAQSLDPAQSEAIRDWIAIGYPWDQIATPEHQRFLEAYLKKFNQRPQLSSVFGYTTMMAIAAGLKKSGAADGDALVDALRGLQLESPLGPIAFRALDQQATMGAFVGQVSQKDGRGSMSNWRYLDGAAYMPNAVYVRSRRPGAAMK
ncbi:MULTISPECIES: ABC transporter substrate-binding protein [unclassified Herbaspirillum]|uniref:ABC transporter substrate-binding protein n=1 Tax=unclassified Herbaspirillum TaxID=2624150 RepID=UPI001174463A|nr:MULTISPECIES: ABC transporter substrate-binding protein [unclassified Herbaspirillum]MBB5390958.1 branched-chain amino acid transport system substrate-binding protein [Herbaspirillum sp. SJZ102]TQK06481.1 amino acid/amide ABC transporter substrate-binding protein (HAAT family) [Herbaspirillum sp. SJZ130]TQK12041.1 amino acid/amide ABC transporter substrate-binding protein (HAAT family) [Herbaspirillum sp. SJZ106]TWC64631.1 amino acid/amide ABC transporter substrate-binding protein (HAAT fami